jgi:SAM-dependent methyltransferase
MSRWTSVPVDMAQADRMRQIEYMGARDGKGEDRAARGAGRTSDRGEAAGDWAKGFFTGAGLEVVRDPERENTAGLEAEWIQQVLRLRPGDRVLDVPCGSGRIAIQLATAGIRVTGIDRSAPLLREARRRGRDLKASPVYQQGDMRRLDQPPRFEAAINWWGSFGYFSDQENEAVVRGMAAALRPGGRLLIDMPNREQVRRWALGRHEIDWTGVRIRHDVAWNPKTQRIEGEWLLVHRGRTRRLWSSIRLYTPSQLRELAVRAGLTRVRLFGDWTGAPYTRGSLRCVLLARKPEGHRSAGI